MLTVSLTDCIISQRALERMGKEKEFRTTIKTRKPEYMKHSMKNK